MKRNPKMGSLWVGYSLSRNKWSRVGVTVTTTLAYYDGATLGQAAALTANIRLGQR
jgi:hypothetical protein